MIDAAVILSRLDALNLEIARLRWEILAQERVEHRGKRAKANGALFADLPAFGMWAGREDMQDGLAWVTKQRTAWSQRMGRGDG